jgi:molybdate transport system substrate-binding protein
MAFGVNQLGFGVFVKKGAAKPDIGSVDAFKHAFLKAHSIASFNSQSRGPTNPHQAHVFEQLGISTDMNPKIIRAGTSKPSQVSSAPIFELVASGDAEIGLAAISEILQAPGVELVGPVPAEIQSFIIFTAAIPVNAKDTAAAKAFVDFLTSSKATAILKSKGLE